MNLYRVITGVLSSHIRRSSQWPSIHRSPFTALQLASISAEADAPAKHTNKKVAKRMPEAEPPNLSPSPSVGAQEESVSLNVPAPKEIPFQTKVANVVHLIGSVVVPVKVQMSPNGSFAAVSVISREEEKGLPKFWIPIIFVGNVAQIAASYLKEKDVIYVTGKLCGGAPPHTIKDATTNIQVLVDTLSIVQNVYPGKVHDNLKEKVEPTSVPEDNRSPSDYRKNMVNSEEDAWNDLVLNSHNWWDNRTDKLNGLKNPRYPDFTNKGTKKGLWLSSSPSWVLPKLNGLVFDTNRVSDNCKDNRSPSDYRKNMVNSEEDAWNDLVLNSHNWCDNRTDKLNGLKNPRYPDFKNKGTKKGLWLSSSPSWVSPKLNGLVFDTNRVSDNCKENLWKSLLDDPNQWWDHRSSKMSKNHPDFKHKETGEGLWLDPNTPQWIMEKLPPTTTEKNVGTFSSSATLLS